MNWRFIVPCLFSGVLAFATALADPKDMVIEIYRVAPGKLDAAFKKLGIPQGAKFFVSFRQLIAEHTDTYVEATTAAEYLKKLD
jgi:hypothetical protein